MRLFLIRFLAILLWSVGIIAWWMFQPKNTTLHPFPYNAEVYKGLQGEHEVMFHGLHSCLYKNDKSDKIVLFSHGSGENVGMLADRAKTIRSAGINVFAYDYRGYGKSSGKASVDGLVDDANSAYNYLTEELHYKPEQIVLFGESIGGAVSAEIATHHRPAGLVLYNTFTTFKDAMYGMAPAMRYLYGDWALPSSKLETIKTLPLLGPPVLVFAGAQDQMISPTQGEAIAKAAHGDLVLLPTATHAGALTGEDMKVFRERLEQFIETRVDHRAHGASEQLRKASFIDWQRAPSRLLFKRVNM